MKERTMKKLKLGLDELRVESFTTAKPEEMRGTVNGRIDTSCGERCTCDCPDENTVITGENTIFVQAVA
jgi:hypothetical protein